MTAKTHALAFVLALLSPGISPLDAQVGVQAVILSAQGGGYSALYNAYNLATGSTDDFKLGFTLGGSVGLQVHKYVELRVSLTGAQSHLRVNGRESNTYLNRYYVGADVKGSYPLPGGLTPYGLAGAGFAILHEKGASGRNATQGFGHLALGAAHPFSERVSVFVQADAYFYSLSSLTSPALSAYSSAQFDLGWSLGASYRIPR